MPKRNKPITPQTYIRHLQYSTLKNIATSLDLPGTATNWKDLAQRIPRRQGDRQCKYTAEKIRIFEAISIKGESPTMAIFEDWSTANATVQDLIDVLKSLELLSLCQTLENEITRLPAYQAHPPAPSLAPSHASSPQMISSMPPGNFQCGYVPSASHQLLMSTYQSSPPYTPSFVATSLPNPYSIPPSIPERPQYHRQPTEHESLPNATMSIEDLHLQDRELATYSYAELRELTSNFNDSLKLGEGAFGSVFQGVLTIAKEKRAPMSREVAIKRLKLETPDVAAAIIEQFKKEIDVISALQNENILPLVGYSCDGPELCLIYDYMYNGSLSSRLEACREGVKDLTVRQRLEIGRGSAAGISYMHDKNVIHRDIKSSNILLDSKLQPRIGDFGLIRSTSANQGSRTSTNTAHPIGTWVYMSPEACKGTVSNAMDVYSFGVVLLELLTGEAVVDESRDPSHLTMFVEESIESGDREPESFFDQRAGNWTSSVGEDLLQLSNDCLEHKRAKRPKMKEILERMAAMCEAVASV